MISNRKIAGHHERLWVAILVFLSLLFLPGMALASSPEWRANYDLVMKWINFIILAGVIFKYGRTPIKQFLTGQKEDLASEMQKLEEEKATCLSEISSAKIHAEENKQKLVAMKERLIAQGESRKQAIIDQAQSQGAIMIEAAHAKMETRILQAKNMLKLELADMAFDQAIDKLPGLITDADNQMFLDDYMKSMHLE